MKNLNLSDKIKEYEEKLKTKRQRQRKDKTKGDIAEKDKNSLEAQKDQDDKAKDSSEH